MPTTIFLIAAKQALLDERTTSVSMINIIEFFDSDTFPLFVPEMTLVWSKIRLEQESSELDFLLTIYLNEKVYREFPVAVNFANATLNRSVMTMNGMSLDTPGVLEFRITNASKEMMASLKLPIDLRKDLQSNPALSLKKEIKNTKGLQNKNK